MDDETGDWWGMCNYSTRPGMQYLNWIQADHLCPSADLTDDDCLGSPRHDAADVQNASAIVPALRDKILRHD
ncbi:hypothetical protein AAII07_15075 [Microvirga sp. 0TCS3.31]